MPRRLTLLLALAVVLLAAVGFFRSDLSAVFLWQWSEGGRWLWPLISVAALVDSVNPCAFSILLLTIAFLFSLGRLQRDVLKIGSVYILGLFITYLLIGLGIVQALHLFNTPHFMAKVGATLLVLLGGINLIGYFFPSFPIRLRIPQAAHQKIAELMERSSLPFAFLLGGLVGLCEFPCTGGPYLAAIGLLHDQATYAVGLGYLVWYNLIFVLPLVVILLIASDRRLLERVQAWRKQQVFRMRLWTGVAMVLLGLLIFSW